MWRKKIFNEGNQIHNFISSSGSGTVINYGSGSDFLTSYGSGSGSTSQKVTVPTVPVPVPQHCTWGLTSYSDVALLIEPVLGSVADPYSDRWFDDQNCKRKNSAEKKFRLFFKICNIFFLKPLWKTIYRRSLEPSKWISRT